MMDKRMKNQKALLFVAALLPVAIIGGLFTEYILLQDMQSR